MTHPLKRPADSAGELFRPTGISPEEVFQAIGRLRQEAQDEIERLLSFLDATEGDVDLEPSLGFPEPTYWGQQPSDPGTGDDREEDADFEQDADTNDSSGVMGPRLNQDGNRDQYQADLSAKKLLIGKRKQVRARKAGRQAAGRAAHAR